MLVSLAYPSKETEFTDHVGKEAFMRALNDGPLQLEVMKGEPSNLESALNYATKYEACGCSLVSQGTLSKSSAYIMDFSEGISKFVRIRPSYPV